MTLAEALEVVIKSAHDSPQELGKILHETNETGHTWLCRFLHAIAHYGPHGTFVRLDSLTLESGGNLCSFGVECGQPTKSYMDHMNEVGEEFRQISRMLLATGAMQSMIWQNPRFCVDNLCSCGKTEYRSMREHDPLCPYRVENAFPVSIEEYRAALQRTLQ